MLDFVDITVENIHLYCRFEQIFEEDLKNFLSRIYPENSDFFTVMIKENSLRWSYLFYDGKIIGSIWLEKEHPTLPVATLGIFIAEKELRSHGIGALAITEYLRLYKEELGIQEVVLNVRKENIRALSCYEKCGFICEKQFEKENGVKVCEMSKILQ
ncbi:MAG: GNAT family N-acetyltransferase [Oscillospiraceae bacterium]